jgi:hypothetical protein
MLRTILHQVVHGTHTQTVQTVTISTNLSTRSKLEVKSQVFIPQSMNGVVLWEVLVLALQLLQFLSGMLTTMAGLHLETIPRSVDGTLQL